jgi:hypothetical protein
MVLLSLQATLDKVVHELLVFDGYIVDWAKGFIESRNDTLKI